MKIKKYLTEDADLQNGELLDATAPTSEIADAVQDATNLPVSDEKANEVAKEIQTAAKKVNADDVIVSTVEYLGVDNTITKALNRNFNLALDKKEEIGPDFNTSSFNILISGLPGSAKTASVYDWSIGKKLAAKADSNLPEANICYINAKSNDLESVLNGYILPDKDEEGRTTTSNAPNQSLIDELSKPNTIIFLDEYNRQRDPGLRGSLLTLIRDHVVLGRGGKPVTLNNILFTVACINPATLGDDVADLTGAELSRFATKLYHIDSNVADAKEYFKRFYAKRLSKLDPKAKNFEKFLLRNLHELDIVLFILSQPDFSFDDEQSYAEVVRNHATPLDQRTLSALMDNSDGSAGAMLDFVIDNIGFTNEKTNSNKTGMLKDIIKRYLNTMPTDEELKRNYGIKIVNDKVSADTSGDFVGIEDDEEIGKAVDGEGEIDSSDIFTNTATSKTTTNTNKQQATASSSSGLSTEQEIDDFIDNLL